MQDLAVALGLVLVIEGASYALFPGQLKRMMVMLLSQPEGRMRLVGLFAALAGFTVVSLARM